MTITSVPAPQTATRKQSLVLLGATGTIGQNTLNILETHPERFELVALTAGENVALLAEQAKKFRPRRAVIANEALYGDLKQALAGSGIEAAAGDEAVTETAFMPCDVVMSAIVGAAALKPTLAAIRAGRKIALANKECLVCAGELMNKDVLKHGATLIPVDSEHNAIFQLFDFNHPEWVEKVTLTASGGPFRNWTLEQMKNATPQQAIKHPNWNMGAKISIDSATLMNKGLELIEAFYLFPLKAPQLDIIIHPQSILHCLVQMVDGSVLAQMSHPDMRTPIAYALGWPERIAAPVKKLNFSEIGSLQFEAPDETRFPATRLAKAVLVAGGNAPTVLNAANEIAVGRFLQGEIGFLDIVPIVEKTLSAIANAPLRSLEDVLGFDRKARNFAETA